MRATTRPRLGLHLTVLLGLALAPSLPGCATSSSGNPDAADNEPDASANTPDAASGTPDAAPGTPDAAPGTPDAAPGTPDAAPGTPDAAPSPPDATPPPDAYTCPTVPCDLYEQCGCTLPQVCDLDPVNIATGGTSCRSVATPGEETATCSAWADCAGGFVCLGDPGQCRRWCQEDADCPGAGGLCILGVTYAGNPVPNATTCTKDCDPLAAAPAGCPSGYACHVYLYDPDETPDSGDEASLTDCSTAGSVTSGGTCTYSSDCIIGYDCIGGTCMENCEYPGGACTQGTCYPFTTPAIIGGIEYGVCVY